MEPELLDRTHPQVRIAVALEKLVSMIEPLFGLVTAQNPGVAMATEPFVIDRAIECQMCVACEATYKLTDQKGICPVHGTDWLKESDALYTHGF